MDPVYVHPPIDAILLAARSAIVVVSLIMGRFLTINGTLEQNPTH